MRNIRKLVLIGTLITCLTTLVACTHLETPTMKEHKKKPVIYYDLSTEDINVSKECGGMHNSHCWGTISFLSKDGSPVYARLGDIKFTLEDDDPYQIRYVSKYSSAHGTYILADLTARKSDYNSDGDPEKGFFSAKRK